jgi:hypothetical protein
VGSTVSRPDFGGGRHNLQAALPEVAGATSLRPPYSLNLVSPDFALLAAGHLALASPASAIMVRKTSSKPAPSKPTSSAGPTSTGPQTPNTSRDDSSNVFDSSELASQWAQNRAGVTSGALKAISSTEPPSESLVLHNIRYVPSGRLLSDHGLHVSGAEGQNEFVTSSLLRSDAAQVLASRGPLPSPPAIDSSAFDIRKVSKREGDQGIFALRDLVPGTVVITERPVLVFPSYLWLGGLDQEKDDILRTLFERLRKDAPDQLWQELMALKYDKSSAPYKEEGILRTNGFELDLAAASDQNDSSYSGVFLNIARCNHRYASLGAFWGGTDPPHHQSCSPNAIIRWDIRSFTMTLHVVREIKKEGEITITYTDLLEGVHKRKSRLEASYGFQCACSKCSLTGKKKDRSNEARTDLQKWMEAPVAERLTFSRWLDETSPDTQGAAQRHAEGLAKLDTIYSEIISEGLQALRAPYMECVDTLARMYGASGNTTEFAMWTKRAIDVWRVDADRSEVVEKRIQTYERWLADPPANFNQWASRPTSR